MTEARPCRPRGTVLDLTTPRAIFLNGPCGACSFRGEGLNIATPSPSVRSPAWRKGSTRRLGVAAAIAGGLFCAVGLVVQARWHTRDISTSLARPALAAGAGRSAAGWILAGGVLLALAAGRASRTGRTIETSKRQAERPARSEGALKEEKQLLQSILDSMSDGVVAANLQGEFILFNPAAEAIVGLGPGGKGPQEWTERYGVYLPDATTPYPPERLPLARAIRGESVDGDIQFLRHAGAPDGVWLRVSARPIRDEDGALRGGVVVFSDMSERRRAEQRINDLNQALRHRGEELEATNKELETFSYSVSHDLRAPLRHISGFVDLLRQRSGEAVDDTSRHYLHTLAESARRMGALIDDLLVFSRMGRSAMRIVRVDLGALVEDVRRELQHDSRGRTIEWRIAPLPPVEGDPAMLRLVLANLLSNAVKYTRPRDPARIEIGAETRNGDTVVCVRDNGVGFDMEYKDKLFGVFQRLHSTEQFEGTGIGLANVRRIVRRHGGRTWAEGEVDRGAAFYFSLPRCKEDPT